MKIKQRTYDELLEISVAAGMSEREMSVAVHRVSNVLRINVSGGTMSMDGARMLHAALGFVIASVEHGEVT